MSIFLSLTRQLIFLIPLLAVLPAHFGVSGVWASMAGSDILAATLAVTTVIYMNKRLKNDLNKPINGQPNNTASAS